jgi:hypothetical protein
MAELREVELSQLRRDKPFIPYEIADHLRDEMLDEIERLRVLVVSAHALNYARGLCSCGWLPVDLRDGNANYSWGCPDDWRIEHAAHVEELLNGGAK